MVTTSSYCISLGVLRTLPQLLLLVMQLALSAIPQIAGSSDTALVASALTIQNIQRALVAAPPLRWSNSLEQVSDSIACMLET
jgi:uncharacterized protein YkwD